ncbi:hypothetical protein CC86DRAFT_379467 [Ophiobolus disseminans]|uniref:Uncharacterized protein n=1 Tax=Ophiobolus disseminans TaxID=1469910 RepID=A0A6A7AB72_9PLEO|nr:hypothetical protein CC86DRAFT_379467 [Ophiobolus disseminans]
MVNFSKKIFDDWYYEARNNPKEPQNSKKAWLYAGQKYIDFVYFENDMKSNDYDQKQLAKLMYIQYKSLLDDGNDDVTALRKTCSKYTNIVVDGKSHKYGTIDDAPHGPEIKKNKPQTKKVSRQFKKPGHGSVYETSRHAEARSRSRTQARNKPRYASRSSSYEEDMEPRSRTHADPDVVDDIMSRNYLKTSAPSVIPQQHPTQLPFQAIPAPIYGLYGASTPGTILQQFNGHFHHTLPAPQIMPMPVSIPAYGYAKPQLRCQVTPQDRAALGRTQPKYSNRPDLLLQDVGSRQDRGDFVDGLVNDDLEKETARGTGFNWRTYRTYGVTLDKRAQNELPKKMRQIYQDCLDYPADCPCIGAWAAATGECDEAVAIAVVARIQRTDGAHDTSYRKYADDVHGSYHEPEKRKAKGASRSQPKARGERHSGHTMDQHPASPHERETRRADVRARTHTRVGSESDPRIYGSLYKEDMDRRKGRSGQYVPAYGSKPPYPNDYYHQPAFGYQPQVPTSSYIGPVTGYSTRHSQP